MGKDVTINNRKENGKMSAKITREGKKKIEDRIEELQNNLKKLRDEKLIAYNSTGDTWHDNPYFNKLEADERVLELEISETIKLLKDAEIVESDQRNMEIVGIGSIVKCLCTYPDFEETIVWEIVGHGEADVNNGKIHYESLVAQNILGLHLNDTISFKTPGGEVNYKILKFYKDWTTANQDN